jgi:hypothetical protein
MGRVSLRDPGLTQRVQRARLCLQRMRTSRKHDANGGSTSKLHTAALHLTSAVARDAHRGALHRIESNPHVFGAQT